MEARASNPVAVADQSETRTVPRPDPLRTMSLPNGVSASGIILKFPSPRAIPMMVMSLRKTHDLLFLGLELILRQNSGVNQVLQFLDRLDLVVE